MSKQQIIEGANKPFAENPKEKVRRFIVSGVLRDFLESRNSISGYGIFEGIAEATLYAEKISQNQLRQLTRYGIVPAAFIDFLGSIGVKVDKKQRIQRKLTEGHLAWCLMRGKYDWINAKTRSNAEYIGKMILLSQIADLARSFRVTQDMERALDLYKKDRR
ncbi:MAG: hypothetical protein WCJ37_02285 [Syntrophus sp. (in: bacteria)]